MRNRIKAAASIVVGGAALVLPASALAVSFGADLDRNVQPSNASEQGDPCSDVTGEPGKCTRVLMEGYQNAGGEKAPKDGKIRQIKLIAQGPGHFKLVLAKAKPNQEKAKVTRRGPRIEYKGQPNNNALTYKVEKFDVNLKVKKGEWLGIESKRTSMLRCSGGGAAQLLFQPPLPVGGDFKKADSDDGCFLLLEAVIR